uniref:Uncharacterized protein n=1 Tax=Oryzias sinensis TaxID=183150 RepID=A0A8C7WXA5_9TELE
MSEKFSRHRRAGNDIPSGRQLPRTPPMKDVKKILDFSDQDLDFKVPQQNEESNARSGRDPETTADAPHSMLKGMKGYQVTQSDLEFLKKMEEEKLIKKLQSEFKEVQTLLKKETMALEQAWVCREKEQAELNKFPSREELSDWVQVVLRMTTPAMEFADMDVKSLLAKVTVKDVQKAIAEKKKGVAQMRKSLSIKRKKEAEEQGRLEREIASHEMKIQKLMRELSELKSELSEQEAAFEPQDQPKKHKAPQENLKMQDAKTKRRGQPRKEETRQNEEPVDKGSGTRRTRPVSRSSGKEEGAPKNKSGATEKSEEKTKKGAKAGRAKPKAVEEQKVNSHESVAGRGKLDEAAASTARNHRKTNAGTPKPTLRSGKAVGGVTEEVQNVVLRRSKRIINKR